MSDGPASGAPAPRGYLGVLRAWLRTWTSEFRHSSEDPRMGLAASKARHRGAVRVLVADDNPVNLMMMSELMELHGLVPLLAADGAEAVALACEMRFDLILMDLQMPVLDGLDATVAIRRFEKSRLLPAVPVLAYSSAFPGAGVLAAHGMSGSLVKPCEDRDLEDCLVRWCPGYLAGATVRGDPYDQHSWQAAKRSSGARGASLR